MPFFNKNMAEGRDRFKVDFERYASTLAESSEYRLNISQVFIETTEDKVRLCLNECLETMERRREWLAPAGVLATLATTWFTVASFRDFLSLPACTWQAVYVIATIIFSILLVRSLLPFPKRYSVDEVIIKIKGD